MTQKDKTKERPKSKPKASMIKPWKPIEIERYADVIQEGVHFPFKVRHSNATGGGIRIASGSPKPWPYISLSSLADRPELLILDHKGNASQSGVFAQANLIWRDALPDAPEEIKERTKDVAISEKQSVLDIMHETLSTTTILDDPERPLSPRLCQVLLPRKDGGYLAVTPLPSPALAGYLIREAWQVSKSSENRLSVRRAGVMYGGNKPQNVGVLVHQMSEPLIFNGPSESWQAKRIWSLYYRGVSTRVVESDVRAYYNLLMRVAKRDANGKFSNHRDRAQEKACLKSIVKTVLNRGRRAYETLSNFDGLPSNQGILSPEVDWLRQGLIDPSKRDVAWREAFAQDIAHQIVRYRFRDGETMPLDESEINPLAKIIGDYL